MKWILLFAVCLMSGCAHSRHEILRVEAAVRSQDNPEYEVSGRATWETWR